MALVEVLVLGLWFSASTVVPTLRAAWDLDLAGAVWLTASVQVGFAVGAVVSAALSLADRVPLPGLVASSALLGAAATVAVAVAADGLATAVPLRFLTGVALAGAYPPGMKLVVSWHPRARGTALGVLIGALAVGSALPHALAGWGGLPWRGVLIGAAGLALAGAALCLAAVRSGPAAGPSARFRPGYMLRMAADRRQRGVTLGYIGHMWELYALWTWLPVWLAAGQHARDPSTVVGTGVELVSFAVIGPVGAVGCVVAGVLADRYGRVGITAGAMIASGGCAVGSWFAFGATPAVLGVLLVLWGATAVADSAQFSAGLSEAADPQYVGTALTVQTALGFALSAVSIQLLGILADTVGWRAAMPVLAVGPWLGAVAVVRAGRARRTRPDDPEAGHRAGTAGQGSGA